jgi:outer membrane autotransporter protein
MKKTYLAKVITTSLILTTTLFGHAGATVFTSGTHAVGGKVNLTDESYTRSAGDITLNATSDLDLHVISTSVNNGYVALWSDEANTTVALNMNNHNVSFGDDAFAVIKKGTNSNVKVLNANDIFAKTKNFNLFQGIGSSGSTELQANHNFTAVSEAINSPLLAFREGNTAKITIGNDFLAEAASNVIRVYNSSALDIKVGNDMTLIEDNSVPPYTTEAKGKNTISVGHNFTIIGANNPIIVKTGSTVDVTVGNDVVMNSSGTSGGLYAINPGSSLNITAKNGKIDILSTGGNTGALISDSGGITTLKAAKDINIGGNAIRGLRAQSGTIDITSDTGSINITANNTTGNINAGIYTNNKDTVRGSVKLHSNANISAVTDGVQTAGGDVVFDKAATITASTAIAATNSGKVEATDTASAKKITGNITADGAGSSADVNFMTADSYLTGATTISNAGAVNLEFANDGTWNVTGDSSLTNLVNNGIVDMRYTGKNVSETITTDNLAGTGNYILNTDLQASYDSKDVQSNGDKIIITTSSTGNNILELRDVSLDTKLASEGYLLLVEDQSNGSATFSGKDLAHGGIFKYVPVITTANPSNYTGYNAAAKNWYLTGFVKTIIVSDNTKANLGLSGTRYANYFMDNDTLLKRLGELRTIKGEPETNGIWARYRHGNMDGDGFSGGSSMVQIGYDKKTSNKRYTGLAFNHTSNSYDFDGVANGDGSQDALTIYNTWLGDKNHYFDIVGKIGKMRGYSTYKDKYYPEKNHYDNWYYSISGEYGRKNIDKNGWYYEPQAQLTLGRVNGTDVTTTTGTKVNMGSITSLISRAGVTFGKEYNMKDANTHSNIYGKINWLHEFKGDVHTSLLDTYGDSYDHEKSYGGSWWNAGIGATINVNKNTHMYLDFERNFGGEVTTNWIGQLGCQWTWK